MAINFPAADIDNIGTVRTQVAAGGAGKKVVVIGLNMHNKLDEPVSFILERFDGNKYTPQHGGITVLAKQSDEWIEGGKITLPAGYSLHVTASKANAGAASVSWMELT